MLKDRSILTEYYRAIRWKRFEEARLILNSCELTLEEYQALLHDSLTPTRCLHIETVKMLLEYYSSHKVRLSDKDIVFQEYKLMEARFERESREVPGDVRILFYEHGHIPLPFPAFATDGLGFLIDTAWQFLNCTEPGCKLTTSDPDSNFQISTFAALMPFWRRYYIKERAQYKRNTLLNLVIPVTALIPLTLEYFDQTDSKKLISVLDFSIEGDCFRIFDGTTELFHVNPTLEFFLETDLDKLADFLKRGWSIAKLLRSDETIHTFKWTYEGIEWRRECSTFQEKLQWRALLYCLYSEDQMN